MYAIEPLLVAFPRDADDVAAAVAVAGRFDVPVVQEDLNRAGTPHRSRLLDPTPPPRGRHCSEAAARMSARHDDAVRREFTKQAQTFEDTRLNTAFTSGLGWLVESFAPEPGDVVLDVAAGTGHVARALAPLTRQVVALDLTRAMLEEGRAQAERAGLDNILFQDGDAGALPHLDQSFDLVVTRFSLHHFQDPEIPLAELVRVCRPGGRVGVADMVADADPLVAERQDRLERLRDPSHTRMLTLEALGRLLERLGAPVLRRSSRQVVRPVRTWLDQARTDDAGARTITQELEAELAGGASTGLRPQLRDGELHFTQTWAVVVGARA
jgi:ubiquinone/menaquinone biosynthesis C-methylase UbiE